MILLICSSKRNATCNLQVSAMISLSYNYGDLSKKCLFGFMKASDHHCIGTLEHFLRTRERATAFKFALIFTGHRIRLETINLTQKSRDKIMDDWTNFKKSFILATIINLSQDEWLVCISGWGGQIWSTASSIKLCQPVQLNNTSDNITAIISSHFISQLNSFKTLQF